MKNYRKLLLIIFFISANAQAFQPKIEIIEQFDNLRMVSFITLSDINSNPPWNPDSEAPPLSVAGAIQAVKDFAKVAESIREIEIRQIPRHEKQWHYLVKVANDSMKSKYSIYVVLMNGTVIPAMIEPQGYK